MGGERKGRARDRLHGRHRGLAGRGQHEAGGVERRLRPVAERRLPRGDGRVPGRQRGRPGSPLLADGAGQPAACDDGEGAGPRPGLSRAGDGPRGDRIRPLGGVRRSRDAAADDARLPREPGRRRGSVPAAGTGGPVREGSGPLGGDPRVPQEAARPSRRKDRGDRGVARDRPDPGEPGSFSGEGRRGVGRRVRSRQGTVRRTGDFGPDRAVPGDPAVPAARRLHRPPPGNVRGDPRARGVGSGDRDAGRGPGPRTRADDRRGSRDGGTAPRDRRAPSLEVRRASRPRRTASRAGGRTAADAVPGLRAPVELLRHPEGGPRRHLPERYRLLYVGHQPRRRRHGPVHGGGDQPGGRIRLRAPSLRETGRHRRHDRRLDLLPRRDPAPDRRGRPGGAVRPRDPRQRDDRDDGEPADAGNRDRRGRGDHRGRRHGGARPRLRRPVLPHGEPRPSPRIRRAAQGGARPCPRAWRRGGDRPAAVRDGRPRRGREGAGRDRDHRGVHRVPALRGPVRMPGPGLRRGGEPGPDRRDDLHRLRRLRSRLPGGRDPDGRGGRRRRALGERKQWKTERAPATDRPVRRRRAGDPLPLPPPGRGGDRLRIPGAHLGDARDGPARRGGRVPPEGGRIRQPPGPDGPGRPAPRPQGGERRPPPGVPGRRRRTGRQRTCPAPTPVPACGCTRSTPTRSPFRPEPRMRSTWSCSDSRSPGSVAGPRAVFSARQGRSGRRSRGVRGREGPGSPPRSPPSILESPMGRDKKCSPC